MGNKAGKNKVTDEDMKFLLSKVEDPSGTEEGKSAVYRLDFTDSGHTKSRIKVILIQLEIGFVVENRTSVYSILPGVGGGEGE